MRGYRSAVRSALTDDGRSPLDTPGERLKQCIDTIIESAQRMAQKGWRGARHS